MWPQQQISAADANRTTFNDVNAAMLTAYQRSGYGLFIGSTKWLISGYVPTNNVTINMARKHRLNEVISEFQQNVALTYVPEVGAVTGFRQTTSQITPYVQSQQIRVTQGTLLLPVSQWQLVASQLQSILNFQYKVNFVTQVTVN
ncbi:hypothetical protein M3Y98_00903300 [Aphelenchoides besseyi]|nr:hypothetical protein M3Y98_00903300 [Aphelenchoides besseyi]